MDKRIQDLSATDPLSPSNSNQNTLLGVQRARIEQLSVSGGGVGQYAISGAGSPLGAAATGAALGILSSGNTPSSYGNTPSAHVTPIKH